MTMLSQSTEVCATHGLPIKCDIYLDADYPEDAPIFLYFHPGGLVDWGRDCIAPWLVQACWQRKWPLISADFRQMPQVGAQGLLDDALAAYHFSQNWNTKDGKKRRVIVGGASGGFFVASLVAHHADTPPTALFSISGIATFRHPFFNSSVLNYPDGFDDAEMEKFIALPLWLGETPKGSPTSFQVDRLLPNGRKNYDFVQPQEGVRIPPHRGTLYEYYVYKNAFVELVGDIDPGYEWAKDPKNATRVEKWPPTVIFHGDEDPDVPLGVSQSMQQALGEDKVKIVVAKEQNHLFELMSYWEDDQPGLESVRQAMALLDGVVS